MKFVRYCQMIWSLLRSEDGNKVQRRKRGNRPTRQRLVAPDRQQIHKTPDTPKIRALESAEKLRHNLRLVGLATLVMATGSIIYFAVRETIMRNPRLVVREVYVEPGGPQDMLTPAQIKQAAGVREGQNLMTVNLKDVREQLLLLPAISMVTITHDFAGKVTVTPVQRVPVAWVKCEHLHWLPMRVGQGLLVDADGRAIPAETVLPDYGKLPVIVDDTIDQITAGAPIASKRFVAAMDLMKALVERQARDGRMLKSIEVKNKFALVATLSDEFKVTFSYDDIGPELKHYDQFMASARGHQWKLSTLNLAADLNIPVTFQVAEASEPPPAIPVSSASSSRSRVSNNASNSATGRSRSNGKSKSTNH